MFKAPARQTGIKLLKKEGEKHGKTVTKVAETNFKHCVPEDARSPRPNLGRCGKDSTQSMCLSDHAAGSFKTVLCTCQCHRFAEL